MNCERSRELFADYLGEELARGEAQELQLHLKTCQGCRQELALLGSTKSHPQAGAARGRYTTTPLIQFFQASTAGLVSMASAVALRDSGGRHGLLCDLCGQPFHVPHTTEDRPRRLSDLLRLLGCTDCSSGANCSASCGGRSWEGRGPATDRYEARGDRPDSNGAL